MWVIGCFTPSFSPCRERERGFLHSLFREIFPSRTADQDALRSLELSLFRERFLPFFLRWKLFSLKPLYWVAGGSLLSI